MVYRPLVANIHSSYLAITLRPYKKAACKHTQDLQAEQGELLNFKPWFGRRF